jgi:hypothetical protein
MKRIFFCARGVLSDPFRGAKAAGARPPGRLRDRCRSGADGGQIGGRSTGRRARGPTGTGAHPANRGKAMKRLWILGVALGAVALFMYISIIVKMG